MNRRGFLSLLGVGAAGFALDPERLPWQPGAKTIFLPSQPLVDHSASLKAGDVFTISGVYVVNPLDVKQLQEFRVKEVASSATVQIVPTISGVSHHW